jgi:hypothetical protein
MEKGEGKREKGEVYSTVKLIKITSSFSLLPSPFFNFTLILSKLTLVLQPP